MFYILSVFPAFRISHPSNERINRSFQMCIEDRECTRRAPVPGYQTSLSCPSLNGRPDCEVVLTRENKTPGFLGYKWKRKENRYTKEQSHRADFEIVKLPSRQKGNVEHTSGWIIYKVVKHQKKPRNNLIPLKWCSVHIVWSRHQHRVCYFVGIHRIRWISTSPNCLLI